jgi:hypothetical protein
MAEAIEGISKNTQEANSRSEGLSSYSNISPSPSGRLDAEIVDDSFEAGRVNTTRLIIKNPFGELVRILEILPPKASTLREISGIRDLGRHKNERANDGAWKSFGQFVSDILTSIGRVSFRFFGLGSADIQFGEVGESESKSIAIQSKENSIIKFDQALPAFTKLSIQAEPGSSITIAGTPVSNSDAVNQFEPVQIAPHCEVVQYFPFKTSGWLMFKPTKLHISVQIRYEINSEERSQVVGASLDVKPPLSAMVIGSLTGSVLGTTARISTQPITFDPKAVFITYFSAIVMSLIATILLSRKTGAQGFITVEDFFGAFVVGTLIGYTGSSYFSSIMQSQENHAAPGH